MNAEPGSAPLVLTVAFPTYNRAASVEVAVERALQQSAGLPIEVLVADNASPDDTLARLERFRSHPGFRLVRGDANVGLAGNMVRITHNAGGRYVLFLSDENDVADAGVLADLLGFLEERAPSLAYPGHRFEPGSDMSEFDRFWDVTGVLPGLVYEREMLLSAVRDVDAFGDASAIEEMWRTYPMVLLALRSWLEGRAFLSFGRRLYTKRETLPTQWEPPAASARAFAALPRHASLPAGKRHYKHAYARLAQQEGLAVWSDHVHAELAGTVHRRRSTSFSRWQRAYAAEKLVGQLPELYPRLHPALVSGLRRELGPRRRVGQFARRVRAKLAYETRRLRGCQTE